MKKDHIINISFAVLVFCFLSFVGWLISQSENKATLKVIGIDYAVEDAIIVEVDGAVKNRGEYSVAAGTPLHDVIYMAGGLSKDGDPQSIDLGKILTKSCKIVVGTVQPGAKDVQEASFVRGDGKCNINTASQAELEAIEGIGESIAQNIINYRKINGSFKETEDIQNVKGVGQKKYEAIREFITVGG